MTSSLHICQIQQSFSRAFSSFVIALV